MLVCVGCVRASTAAYTVHTVHTVITRLNVWRGLDAMSINCSHVARITSKPRSLSDLTQLPSNIW